MFLFCSQFGNAAADPLTRQDQTAIRELDIRKAMQIIHAQQRLAQIAFEMGVNRTRKQANAARIRPDSPARSLGIVVFTATTLAAVLIAEQNGAFGN